MRTAIILVIGLLLLVLPFTDGKPEKHFLDITSLTINFDKADATFTVNYDLGELTRLYILLLGSKDLEPKIYSVFSNFDYKIVKMDQDRAVLRVTNISRFEKGYYLHDSRIKFGETIGTVNIYFPDDPVPRDFYNINSTPVVFYRS
jgi:hypothetical protein